MVSSKSEALHEFELGLKEIEQQIEEEKKEFTKLKIHNSKLSELNKAEAKEMLKPVLDQKFRLMVEQNLTNDLSDVDPEDIAKTLHLYSWSNLGSLHKTTLQWFLRVLQVKNLHETPEIQELWVGKKSDTERLAVHGKMPRINCGSASKHVLGDNIPKPAGRFDLI